MIRQTKTTLKELTAQYRSVLRHAFLTSIAVMGVVVATPANATISDEDMTTIENTVAGSDTVMNAVAGSDTVMNAAITAVAGSDTVMNAVAGSSTVMNAAVAATVANANIATEDGSYYGQTWDSEHFTLVNATEKTQNTTVPTDVSASEPVATGYTLDLSTGSTNLNAYTGGYSITDPEADPAGYSIKDVSAKLNLYTYTITNPDGTTTAGQTLDSSEVVSNPVYSTTGYNYNLTTGYRYNGDSSANIVDSVSGEADVPLYSDYKFTDGVYTYRLSDYINENGDLALSATLHDGVTKLEDNIAAVTDAAASLHAYGDDKIAYNTMKARYDATNDAYGTAIGNVNSDQNKVNAAIATYRDEYGQWKAEDNTYNNYTDAQTALAGYNASLAKVINTKATDAATAVLSTKADLTMVGDQAVLDSLAGTTGASVTDVLQGQQGAIGDMNSLPAGTTLVENINTNKGAIATLNGDENTAGSVAKSVKDATTTTAAGNYYASGASVLTAVAGVDGQTKTNTDAIATLNGDENTTGSVAKSVKDATTTTAAGNYYASGASVLTAIAGVDGQTKTNTDGISTLNTALTAETANRAAADQYILDKMDGLEDNMSAGVASAVALSSVAVSNVRRGEVSVGGGYGYYNDQSALALGAAMGLSDRWSVNAGAGLGLKGSDNFSVRAGTNYKFKLF